ncbi:hypothetical protein JVX98_28250 [Ensifer sp. PDNC004]|uniref:hypothetical protein n=1 Tax=Ensifer sp. PDNC004 TaxID=2811423 RepID=UPI001966B41F|nr:hypothetical protein [Ensifer sp. PDNC004]QRY68183.1 hypothetical protein JVX98_28250 [Ensifer sp. PDNC004]
MSEAVIRDMIVVADAYPVSLVSRVVDRYRLGQVEGQSLDFPPKLPQLAVALRAEPRYPGEAGYLSPDDHRRRMIEANDAQLPKHSEEAKARVRKLVRAFVSGHDVSAMEGGAK